MAETQQQNPEQNCLFCQIASGKIQAKKVYEDQYVIGFLDINPSTPGHLLLIPKQHYSLMMQAPQQEVSHMFNVSQALSNSLLKALDAEGTTVFMANGAAAGQRSPHMMIHIIPRYEGDNLNFTVEEKEADQQALEKFRQSLVPLVNEAFGIKSESQPQQQEQRPQQPQKDEKQPDEPSQPQQKQQEKKQEPGKQEQNKGDDVSLDDVSKMFK